MTDQTTIEIDGMHCAACVGRAERVLARVPGVSGASVNLATTTARLTGSPDLAAVATALSKAGYGLRQSTTTLTIDGMTCASCVGRVERALQAVPGIQSATVNLASQTALVTHVAGPDVLAAATAAVARAGYHAEAQTGEAVDRAALEATAQRKRFLLALALTLPVFVLEMGGHLIPAFHHWVMASIGMQTSWTVQFVLTTLVLAVPGRQFLTRGLPALARLSPDMNSLVAMGTLSAWAYSTLALLAPQTLPEAARAVYYEAAAVIVTLILMGRWLEARARGQTGAAIRRLIGLQPASALVETDSGPQDRPTAALRPGDILRIRPGERIATDSVVLSGSSYVDESMITGEPVPVHKAEGTPVTGGTVNGTGGLRVQVTRTGADTTLAQIVRLVAEAQGGKLPIQALVDRVTLWFVPAVMGVAALTVLVWLLVGPAPVLTHALVAGVSVLIVACPCAMGLATPTSIMVGTGRAAELGALFRRGEALQRLAQIRGIAFDKTGTLTLGRPELTEIIAANGHDPDATLRLAAGAEALSEHPVAHAITKAATARGLTLPDARDMQTDPGYGLRATVDQRRVTVGAERMMLRDGIELGTLPAQARVLADQGRTVLYAAIDGQVAALLAVADPVKPGAAQAVAGLRALGLQVAMISGDGPATAGAVARSLGIEQVTAGVLPAGKVEALRALGEGYAFAGDGINDAPALAASEVGLAMGNGTDVAIEAADVVLVGGDPRAVLAAVTIARATLRNIRQNLFWAFGYNVALIPVAAGVLYPLNGTLLSPMLAAGAMALSSVFVLSNALRLRRAGAIITQL